MATIQYLSIDQYILFVKMYRLDKILMFIEVLTVGSLLVLTMLYLMSCIFIHLKGTYR